MTEKEIDDKCLELLKHHNNISLYTEKTIVYSTLLAVSSSIVLVSFANMTDNPDNAIMYGLAGSTNVGLSLYELKQIASSLINRGKEIEKFDKVLEELDNETGRLR